MHKFSAYDSLSHI